MPRILRTCFVLATGLALAACIPACEDNGLVIEFPTPVDSHWWDGFDAQGMNNYVYVLAEYEGDLVAGGLFSTAGTQPVNGLARWDGTAWSGFGNGMTRDDCTTGFCQPWVSALTLFGNDLVAGGRFTHAGDIQASNIAVWDGTQWSALGDGFDDTVFALAEYQGRLVAGGIFTRSGNDTTISHLAQWTGTKWETLGGGTDATVRTLVVDGTDLIVGGDFNDAGTAVAPFLASWDGSQWTGFAPYLNGGVQAAGLYGQKLIVGGNFNGVILPPPDDWKSLPHVGAWTGSEWEWLSGFNDDVSAIGSYQGQLVSGGAFTRGDGPANYLARWDPDHGWISFGTGLDRRVTSILSHDDHLYVGGWFRNAGGKISRYIARWDDE